MGAIENPVAETGHQVITPSECVLCLDCFADCPQRSISLSVQPLPSAVTDFDPGRREVLGALASGAAGASLLRANWRSQNPGPFMIRPPGVKDEVDFVSTCIRCSECMQVCPTSGLQPALFQAGPEGLWTPYLVPRTGYCDYSCNACGQVCPTGAIPPLDLETKRQEVIGLAVIDRSRCLPWAYATPCIVCEEMCPIPDKAIRLEEVTEVNDFGEEVFLQQPYVLRELCIGCGICEQHCPMEARAAIQVQRRQGLDLPIF
jgi:MauM/NapG family ferredoxin protein